MGAIAPLLYPLYIIYQWQWTVVPMGQREPKSTTTKLAVFGYDFVREPGRISSMMRPDTNPVGIDGPKVENGLGAGIGPQRWLMMFNCTIKPERWHKKSPN